MLIDLHVHTANTSVCGKVSADDVVKLYKEKTAYDAIVITDHINGSFLGKVADEEWEDTVTRYLAGYRLAKETADSMGFTVLLGCELRFDSDPNDYLLYGITEDFLRSNPHINRMKLREFSSLAKENGILLYQAHPFRNDMRIVNPELLFGVEVGNGAPKHNSRNAFASMWADCYNLHKIAGSDFHEYGREGRGGIVTNRSISTNIQLTDMLSSDDYLLALTNVSGFYGATPEK